MRSRAGAARPQPGWCSACWPSTATWLGTVAVLALGGPGGDIVFGGPGIMGYSVLLLMVLGALPAALVLRRMR